MSQRPPPRADTLQRQNRRLKQQNRRQRKIVELKESNKRLRLEPREYRQQHYKAKSPAAETSAAGHRPKKRGASKGHPGWSRPVPRHVDKHVDVTFGARS